MNAELEALLQAFQRIIDAGESKHGRILAAEFEMRLAQAAERLGISTDMLRKGVERRWRAWTNAQKQPPSIPPKA